MSTTVKHLSPLPQVSSSRESLNKIQGNSSHYLQQNCSVHSLRIQWCKYLLVIPLNHFNTQDSETECVSNSQGFQHGGDWGGALLKLLTSLAVSLKHVLATGYVVSQHALLQVGCCQVPAGTRLALAWEPHWCHGVHQYNDPATWDGKMLAECALKMFSCCVL